ncbi:PAB1-binding protein 1 [Cladobotryum mycophilum]|uniref:PAB1-binding protein 1 n=1 Tax=Cladobotryum mycophilum TaxID=491253 RepID=A0ABR0T0X5_9HYPO
MPATKKETLAERNSMGKMDGRTNGNRSGFRTDTAISNSRFGNERVLQPWVSDTNDAIDGSLEKSNNATGWDQFAENERLFGLKTDYDENMYTTAINKSHPQFNERIAAAEKKAREIERSAAVTSHVAEERIMDYVGTKGEENEEDKYSGVRRKQDFPPLSSGRENKYTPPAKRAPTGQATVKGAPVDPAIISSQIKISKKQLAQTVEQPKAQTPVSESTKNGTPTPKPEAPKPVEVKPAEQAKPVETKSPAPIREVKPQENKPVEKVATTSRAPAAAAAAARNVPPTIAENPPSATSTVERDVLNSFKSFASQQRLNAEKVRSSKAKADKEIKLTELKKFANSFKLSTPVPTDLVSIIAKDPAKQKEIQAKAMKNAEEMAKAKTDTHTKKEVVLGKDAQPKQPEQTPTANAQDNRPARAPAGPQATPPIPCTGGFRNNRAGPSQHPTGSLAQRLHTIEQQKFSQPPTAHQHSARPEVRAPPTGPSNNVDAAYTRRHSGHLGAKLNPNSNEFRPSPFAAAFNPNSHPSASSSPRSSVNHVAADSAGTFVQQTGQLIRRKTKAVDVTKCYILSHIKTITPPQGRNWDENGGLRPSFDTLPTWRQLQDEEKSDSTMHLTYKEYFDRQPFASASMPTPNPPHVVPQLAHQHQLPFHLQHGAHSMVQRQSPHMPPMQMHTPQHGPVPHQQYGNDDHRMMHSNSAQSFASPRMGQLPVAYPGVTPPGQVPYNQPVFVGPGNPQMAQFRSFSNNPHYAPPQGQMGGPL